MILAGIENVDGIIEKTMITVYRNGMLAQISISPDESTVVYRADQDADEVYELFASRSDGSANIKVNDPLSAGQRIEGSYVWAP